MSTTLEFWFEFASTYSYPAAMRVEQVAAAAGVTVAWRPFLLGPIFFAQGWQDSPFNLYPAKGRYMWRDLARICEELDLPWRRPSVFPRPSLPAARVALAAAREPWVGAFVRGIYHTNFAADRDVADPVVVAEGLAAAGVDPEPWLARAHDPSVKDALRAQTERAQVTGIFGAPSFTIGDELFWGHDRLERAVAWARGAA
jgi:2-hydroxychromene-2-carboxylate isomerase